MPTMDGISSTKEIRAYEIFHHLRRIPIVVQTASDNPSTRGQCLEVGCDDVFSKPIDKTCIQFVKDLLSKVPHKRMR